MSALRTYRLYTQDIFLIFIPVRGLSQPHDHSGGGRIMSMKNLNKTIGNGTRALSACSAVLRSTAPQRVAEYILTRILQPISIQVRLTRCYDRQPTVAASRANVGLPFSPQKHNTQTPTL